MSNYFSFKRPLRYEDLMAKARELDQAAAQMRADGFDQAAYTLAAKAFALREKAAQIARGGVE